MKKTMIAPIIGLIFILIQATTGVHVSNDVVQQVVNVLGDGVATGLTLYGVYKNHH